MRNRALVVACALLGTSFAAFTACSNSSTPATAADGGSDGGSPASGDSGSSADSTVPTDSGPNNTDSGNTTDSSVNNGDSSSNGDSGTGDSGTGDSGSDSGTDAGQDSGPGYTTIDFSGEGNASPVALHWDNTNQVLYIADDYNNQVWSYTDAAGLARYAQVPDSPALDDAGHTKLNGVGEEADGTLLVTRFGYGTGGAIYTVSTDGGSAAIPGVPATRKRIAVTVDPGSGTIYSDSFSGGGGSPISGQVETVSLTTGTSALATGLGKTVGLLVQGSVILVSDETNNVILAVPTDPSQIGDGGLEDGGPFPVYASIYSPDMLTAGPGGSIFTDQFSALPDAGLSPGSDSPTTIRQIWPDGGYTVPWPTVLFSGLSDVAYDATNHRLFVIDSNGTTVRTVKIFPVSP